MSDLCYSNTTSVAKLALQTIDSSGRNVKYKVLKLLQTLRTTGATQKILPLGLWQVNTDTSVLITW